MRLWNTFVSSARPVVAWWEDTQTYAQRWRQRLDPHQARALDLAQWARVHGLGDVENQPVVETGDRVRLRRRFVSLAISLCAMSLLLGGVGAFFLFLLYFSLFLVLVSKGLGFRVRLPDVFRTP